LSHSEGLIDAAGGDDNKDDLTSENRGQDQCTIKHQDQKMSKDFPSVDDCDYLQPCC